MNVLGNWSIGEVVSVDPIQSHWGKASWIATSGGAAYVLKERGSPNDVAREEILLRHLDAQGIPVPVPVPARSGLPYALHEGRAFVLYPRLLGSIVTDHYSPGAGARAATYGAAIALLHRALGSFPHAQQYPELLLVDHVVDWAVPTIERRPDGVDIARARTIFGSFEEALSPAYADLPVQLIHRDANPSNILLANGEVTGFIDFDMATRSIRLFDPCYCSTSILVGGWPHTDKRNAWFGLLQALMRGYSLTATERSAVFPVLLAIQL